MNSALASPLSTLQRFARARPTDREQCDLCAAAIAEHHSHVLEVNSGKLQCVCEPCAILFGHAASGKFRRVPRRVDSLVDFQLGDLEWQSLGLPINLAFFRHRTPAGRVVAVYPSPGGPMESQLPIDAWQMLTDANPAIQHMAPDVEAVLVNRVGAAREHFRVSIDECYKLIGLLRLHWRGFSGGDRVWEEIDRFFVGLHEATRHA